MSDAIKQNISHEMDRIADIIKHPSSRTLKQSNPSFPAVRPKLAASVIVHREIDGDLEVLMGKRALNLKFMPGALVFPGGKVDAYDHRIEPGTQLRSGIRAKIGNNLPKNRSSNSAQAIGIAAIRELAEETGLIFGKTSEHPIKHPSWQMFAALGLRPGLDQLSLLARAITPPGLPRRYDTWFFTTPYNALFHKPEGGFLENSELGELGWYRIEQAMGANTREITRVILCDLKMRYEQDKRLTADLDIPFYFAKYNKFRREYLK